LSKEKSVSPAISLLGAGAAPPGPEVPRRRREIAGAPCSSPARVPECGGLLRSDASDKPDTRLVDDRICPYDIRAPEPHASTGMKFLVIALMMAIPLAAGAASPEEGYLSARDRYIETFKQSANAGQSDERVLKEEELARADLQMQLRRIIGTVQTKGLAGPAKLNLETLFDGELGFGMLDGLSYASPDDKAHVVVTTEVILTSWLQTHRNWWPDLANVPQDVDAALTSEAFYTQAMSPDAAVVSYGGIPVSKPANVKFAVALLVARTQDRGPRTPSEVIVSAVQSGRVFVMSEPVRAKIDPIPACDAVRRDYDGQAQKAYEAYQASNLQDDKLFEKHTQLREQGDGAYRRCFAERAKTEKYFVALTRQAQAVLDRLPR